MFEGNKKRTRKEREPFCRKIEYQKEKKFLNCPYDLRALFYVFKCSVTQPLVQGVLFFGEEM